MIMKTTIRNYYTMLTALLLTLSVSEVTLATDGTSTKQTNNKPSEKVEFTFVGKLQDHPVYQLNLNSPAEEEYIISFRESDGTVVYSDVVKGNFSQRFMLQIGEVSDASLSL